LPRLLQAAQAAGSSSAPPPVARTGAATDAWRWRPDPATPAQGLDRRASDWLQRLVQSTRGRWQPVAAAGDAGPAAYVVTFDAGEGGPAALAVTVGERAIDWVEPDGTVWRALLPPGADAPSRP